MAANKLTLSLRAYTYKGPVSEAPLSDLTSFSRRRMSWIGASTFGLDTSFASDTTTSNTDVGSYELPPLDWKKDKGVNT